MRIVINTQYGGEAGRDILVGLENQLRAHSGFSVTNNDWLHYDFYDVAVFMAPDSEVQKAKQQNPKLLVGIFDPKATLARQRTEVRAADFLIVSSIEQREFFIKFNRNIFIYYMFPDTREMTKAHGNKDRIVIGYHGNKQHLDAMQDVTNALDVLSTRHSIAFHAIYNIKKLGRWTYNVPQKCPVKHIQWDPTTMPNELNVCDIGVQPSLLPLTRLDRLISRPLLSWIPYNPWGYNSNDHLLRFKASNNPGRIYVFAQAGIPVVADFTPSSCQFIKDGHSGFVVGGASGWEYAIEKLILDAKLRATCAENLKHTILNEYAPQDTFDAFVRYIATLHESRN